MIGYELTNEVLKLDRANNTDLEPEIAKRAAKVILDVINLPLEEFTGGQQKTPVLARRSLDVHCLEKSDAHHLGDPTGVVAISLIDPRGKDCVHVSGLDTNRSKADVNKPGVDPLR